MENIRVATMADIDEINGVMSRDFGAVDMTEFVEEPLNVCLLADGSLAAFAWRGPGIREVHVAFAVKGREALGLGRRMMRLMRERYGTNYFWSLIPIDNRKVQTFARRIGWKFKGLHSTRHGDCQLFVSEDIPCHQP